MHICFSLFVHIFTLRKSDDISAMFIIVDVLHRVMDAIAMTPSKVEQALYSEIAISEASTQDFLLVSNTILSALNVSYIISAEPKCPSFLQYSLSYRVNFMPL